LVNYDKKVQALLSQDQSVHFGHGFNNGDNDPTDALQQAAAT
jgi:hypothetical protein